MCASVNFHPHVQSAFEIHQSINQPMIVKITFHWGNILCSRNFMHIVLPLKVWEVRIWKTRQSAFWRKTLQLQSSMWFYVFHSTEPFNPTKWLVTSPLGMPVSPLRYGPPGSVSSDRSAFVLGRRLPCQAGCWFWALLLPRPSLEQTSLHGACKSAWQWSGDFAKLTAHCMTAFLPSCK